MAQATAGTQLATTWAQPHARVATSVRVDWNRDGDWSDPYEDITPRVISVTIRHKLYDQLSGLPLWAGAAEQRRDRGGQRRQVALQTAGVWPASTAWPRTVPHPHPCRTGLLRRPRPSGWSSSWGDRGRRGPELYGQGTITLSCVDNPIRLSVQALHPGAVGVRAMS